MKANSWNYTTLNFNSETEPAADYMVNVTGVGDGHTHSVFIPFKVYDFALSTTTRVIGPIGLRVPAVSSVKITALNGFPDSVNFSISSVPGLNASLSTRGVIGSGTLNVTILATYISPGTYTVMITAYHFSDLAHILMLEVRVAYGYELPAYVLPGVVVGAAAAVGAAVYILRRRLLSHLKPELKPFAADGQLPMVKGALKKLRELRNR